MIFQKRTKVLFIGVNWLGFWDNIIKRELRGHFSVKFLNLREIKRWKMETFDPAELNKVLKLLEYELCMELEVYPSELDIEKPDHYEACCFYYAKLLNFTKKFEVVVKNFQPDLVIFMQGYPVEASVARTYCVKNDVPMLALENTFHKEKFLWDTVSGITVNRNQALNYIWRYLDNVNDDEAHQVALDYVKHINSLKTDEHSTQLSDYRIDKKKKTVLLLGQVYTDASTLFGMNNFQTPVDVIEALVAECAANNYHLVLKLHPKELHGRNFNKKYYKSLTLRKIKERKTLYETIKREKFLIDYVELNTFDLIKQADVCITINSQAGFEALLFGQEVITCGKVFYANLGVTFNAGDTRDLRYLLRRVLEEGAKRNDKVLIEKVYYIITEKFFRSKNVSQLKKLIFESI